MACIERWLPSDQIRFRTGFDGYEPAQQAKAQWNDPAWSRAAVAIGTWYPEVQGGFYFNRNLIGLVQESLHGMGISLVRCEYRREDKDGIEPAEALCALEKDEDYCLVDEEQGNCGFLRMWEYWAGGHALGDFYSENVIVDILSDKEGFFDTFKYALADRCMEYGVKFEEAAGGSAVPVKSKSGILKEIKRLL